MSGPETVLITGASSGIGRELAHCFARGGSTYLLLARSEDALHALAETLRARYDVAASVLPADLSAPDAAGTVQAELRERDRSQRAPARFRPVPSSRSARLFPLPHAPFR
jgi:short-subunit dehydrogenase